MTTQDRKRLNGMVAKKVRNGTLNTLKRFSAICHLRHLFAHIVVKSFNQEKQGKTIKTVFVLANALRRIAENQALMMLSKSAKDVEVNMLRTNTKKQNAVHLVGVAKIEIEPNEDVYNMEVMGTHNFAVNGGVIVHNCMDDIRYFCNTIMKNKLRKESNYTPIFM